MKDKIKLINHSSVHILNEKISILTDPWYSGSAFDDGWMLLYENKKEEILKILNNVNYIWYSHEHPDHFSVKFLIDFEDVLKENNGRRWNELRGKVSYNYKVDDFDSLILN